MKHGNYFTVALAIFCYPLSAKIIIDGSLNGGEIKPLLGPNYEININLGQQQGDNLFHSFSTFDLTEGEKATFLTGNGIQNIIARISGGKVSSIDGIISADSASLWMINPAGWFFGANAKIQMNASSEFHVSTADSIRWLNDKDFFSDPSKQSTLTIGTPIGISFLSPQKSSIILDQTLIIFDESDMDKSIPEKNESMFSTFSIVASEVCMHNSAIIMPNSRILIGSTNIANNWDINDKGLTNNNNAITNNTDFSGTGNTDLFHTTIQIDNSTNSDEQTGYISIESNNLHIMERSNISANSSIGKSGNIKITAQENLFLSGDITSSVKLDGVGGIISIEAKNIDLSEAAIRTTTNGRGNAGNINIISQQATLNNNSSIDASTIGNGDAGTITITSDSLNISGKGASILSTTRTNHEGRGGNININTEQLNIENKGEIEATSESLSDAGNITITNTGRINVNDAKITTSAGKANGGKITINSQDLILTNGQITTSVQGGQQGNGGDININSDVLVMDTGFIQANTKATDTQSKGGEIGIQTRVLITSYNNLKTDNETLYEFKPNSRINVIQAASENGLSGNVTTTSPQLNISGELTNLKSELVDIDQIAQNACVAPNTKQSTLVHLSHGGLPESLEQAGNLTLNPERLTQLLAEKNIREYSPDISSSMITDQPNRERFPAPEYPPQQTPPDFSLPPVQSNPPDTLQSQTLTVKQFRFSGNTVFSDEELQALAAPYQQHLITLADLETLRQQLTQHYIQYGYAHSAALLPQQVFSNGTIVFQIIEGKLTDIRISGTDGLHPDYVQKRLNPQTNAPLNAQALQQRFQQLLSDPLIERMDAQLLPGDTPEQNILEIEVTRARPYQLSLGINNHSTPGIGAEEVRMDGWVRNLSGFGDFLGLSMGLTEGRFSVDTRFSIPLNRYDTLLSLRFAHSDASFIAGPLKQIKIKNNFKSYDLTLSQPIYRSVQHNFTLAARLSVRSSHNQLLGRGFVFEAGEKADGSSRVSALRLTQEYSHSQPGQIVSFRSTFNIGLNLFNATWHDDNRPDGNYLSWLGQLQYARKILNNGAQIRLRGDVQLTKDRLLSLERFALGGAYSVRGYRENQQVSDMGYSLSAEFHYPLMNTPMLDYLPGALTLIPFMDYGVAWNQKPDQKRTSLHSVGIGLNWNYKHLNADFFYAHDLNTTRNQQTYNLQDSGIHFRLTAHVF